MTPIEESTIVYTLCEFTLIPSALVSELDTRETLGEIGYRFAHAVQAVISLIALPILVLIGLFESAIRFCLCDEEHSKAALSTTAMIPIATIIYRIPASFLTCIAPLELGKTLSKSLLTCAKEASEIWDCNSGSYEGNGGLDLQEDDEYTPRGRAASSDEGEFPPFPIHAANLPEQQ